MRRLISIILIVSLLTTLYSCSGSRKISIEEPPVGQSVKIVLVDGSMREGVILKREGQEIRYVDTETHKPERLDVQKIRGIVKSNMIYDLEGKRITESEIADEKGITKTLGYGVGGFVLGAAVGFGVGVILLAQDIGKPIYPMAVLGIGGAIYFGMRGANSDFEDAIDDIRSERYKVTQERLKKELKNEQEKLEKQKKELEQLKKKKSKD